MGAAALAYRTPYPLSEGLPEPWAIEWGEDPFGAYMSFGVGDVVQAMRWIPPGSFLMGSPAGEVGRYDNEVQHPVTLSQGFWLADTPCTQALWRAVMGSNPSYFVDPEHPVEQVSWSDCQVFIAKLSERVPGLQARLPTEAEWEYACRGGTSTATWVGNLDILGANNAPALDTIAWYGGNSGQAFDLASGYDSSKWPEKQYAHSVTGTRRVRTRLPNPHGLYDMLGNVYEWCDDWYEEAYNLTSMTDPRGPRSGSRRVMRGGSWSSLARRVRAARRDAYAPDRRGFYLGFRLARGPAPSQVAAI